MACHPLGCLQPILITLNPTIIMKKTLILLALVSAAAANTLNPPLIYSPAVGGPVPNPAYRGAASATAADAARKPTPYAVDLTIGYGFLAVPDSKYATDMVAFELEGAYKLDAHHALTFSVGYAGGGECHDYWVHERGGENRDYPFTDSFDRTCFTMMVGYRFTQPLTQSICLQVGAKCGMDVQTLDIDYGYGWSSAYKRYRHDKVDTAVGMAYAGYANVLFRIARNTDLMAGYQFRGSTAKPSPSSNDPIWTPARVTALRWHELHVGVMFHF